VIKFWLTQPSTNSGKTPKPATTADAVRHWPRKEATGQAK
jgi:hypothetical protein